MPGKEEQTGVQIHICTHTHWFCTFCSLNLFSNYSLLIFSKRVLWYFHCITPMLRGKGFYHIYANALKESHTFWRPLWWGSVIKAIEPQVQCNNQKTKLEPLVGKVLMVHKWILARRGTCNYYHWRTLYTLIKFHWNPLRHDHLSYID